MNTALSEDKAASWVWTKLLEHFPADGGLKRRLWDRLYALANQRFAGRPASVPVHGEPTLLNFGHAYPLFSRIFEFWNQPLIELVYLTAKAKGRAVSFVDVGAGVGDTIRLLTANCPQMLLDVHAVEGDAEFYAYLERNIPPSQHHFLHNIMLSAEPGEMPSLVHHHSGTAAAHGSGRANCTTLDLALSGRKEPIDILKIDVDGFDGQVLAGGRELLTGDRPNVIFEWHPLLYERAKQSWQQPFDFLFAKGYTQFAWFNKYGQFSHFMLGLDRAHIGLMSQLCIGGKHDTDWHYDIVALPPDSEVPLVALAELTFSKQRRSRF